jgi:hypothetical protein
MDEGRSMRAVKDGLSTPSGESEESKDPHWTRAMGDHLACPQGNGYQLAEIANHLGAYAVTVLCSFKQAEQGNV